MLAETMRAKVRVTHPTRSLMRISPSMGLLLALSSCKGLALMGKAKIGPPCWIIGVWEGYGHMWAFCTDNYIQVDDGYSVNHRIELFASCFDVTTDTTYTLNRNGIYATFTKVSENELSYEPWTRESSAFGRTMEH
jgi:hypothetical protein